MKLMSMKQYMSMSKPALIRKITKTLRAMPKKRLAVLCYNITKSKLPRLSTVTRKRLSVNYRRKGSKAQYAKGAKDMYQTLSWTPPKRKTKRKFSRKQLAAQKLFAKRARAGTLRKRRRR
jgi:predicted transcriptional regulator YheO